MKPKKEVTPEAALLKMASLCARSEQCGSEISRKLAAMGLASADAAKVLAELRSRGFVDDARYARAFARDKMRFSGWGRRKIAAGLAAKRLPASAAESALADLDPEEYMEAARRAGGAKARGMDLGDYGERAKFLRHMLGRGFEADVATRVSEEIIKRSRE